MALTETEAKVLAALSILDPNQALTVRQLCRATMLAETSTRRALLRLSHTGLAMSTPQGTAKWRSTGRGRLAISGSGYREYAGDRS